jgi:hypothetical protein
MVLTPASPVTDAVAVALVVIAATSTLTSVVSLIGLATMTVLVWRKERRETKAANIEGKRQEIELVKARLELEKMRGEEHRRVVPDSVSLRRQLAKARDNLQLIHERKSQYVLETDIPLQLVKEEQRLLERIEELEQRVEQLEQPRSG